MTNQLNIPKNKCSWCKYEWYVAIGNASTCPDCGHPSSKITYPLVDPKNCPKCFRQRISPDAFACPGCGTIMKEISPTCKECAGTGYIRYFEKPARGGTLQTSVFAQRDDDGAERCPRCQGSGKSLFI